FAGAKIIKTKYRVQKEKEGISLVEAELVTGRTHQIRAHFAYLGHPLVGDGKYGAKEYFKTDKKNGFFWQALYSYKLKFNFKSDAGILNYLDGMVFTVDDVDFAKKF
ncbi:MAG: RNA pseudouridine synthase, partial [Oscillospiraceae bacterium]|nr:RNA pseudouridine synthase [Oscillospiraceae bacterium]